MIKKQVCIATLFIAIVFSSACQKEPDSEPSSSKNTPQSATEKSTAHEEDTLIIALNNEPDEGYDPIMGWGRYGTPLFQSTLLKREEDQRLSGDLATEWQLSPDRLTWKITIRKDARFSDGTAVTAKDVAFTFNRAAQSGGKTDVTALKKAVATKQFTVDIHLKAPQITFINRLATLGIVPMHAYNATYSRHPVGSGPYQLVRWDEGRQMIMEQNPYYYGKPSEIKKIIFLFMEEDAAFIAAKAGKVHVIRVPQMLARRPIDGMHLCAVKSVDNRGICFPFLPKQNSSGTDALPVGNDVTADIFLRKAINYAIDRPKLVEGILEGYGSPAHGPVSMLPWNEPLAAIADGNLEKARQILKDGGWKETNGDGILVKQHLKASFTLLYPADDSIRQALALAVSDTVRKIGIDIIVTGKSWDDIYKLMHANAVLFGFGSFDQTEMHNLYFGKRTGGLAYNAGYYKNEMVDTYLAQAMASPSENDAVRYWKMAQWDGRTGFSAKGDAAWAWLVNLDHTYFISDRLDIGTPGTEQHGSSITANLPEWKWINNRPKENALSMKTPFNTRNEEKK